MRVALFQLEEFVVMYGISPKDHEHCIFTCVPIIISYCFNELFLALVMCIIVYFQ